MYLESIDSYLVVEICPKQVGSVASQLGKKHVISESFALCGWNVHFEELKWIAEWQIVNGVNLLCQHLSGYTLRGLRKRDYPPSMFIQQPWWEEYSAFNTYMGRLVLLSYDNEINKEPDTRYILKLNRFNTIMAKIFVNDTFVKNIMWAPYEADITQYLENGHNKISIQLIGGNRNLLGPHHHINGELYNVGPESFTGKWSWVEREMEGQVVTEEERKKNYWKDGYCLVKFGL